MDDIKGGFATTAAAMVAILLGSPFNAVTAPYVIAMAERSYSPEVVDLIGIAWMILAYPFVFFAARASILAALTAAGVYIAYRFI
ncbi:hypothetical protein [Maritimibacter fusiformis]|uniref:Chromate transporter n=1 Tax=Maritimibacter fusiformis TaxID=2603819 RepID=A0A5D0RQU2_9RHOB|nr:hypothetical protein [Maritimibacter fusiformis]TYB83479.1 hypothetical protein FVF75_00165 [Maritimibacter fusiformis]